MWETRQSIEGASARFKFQRFHPFKFCGRSSLWTEIHDGFQTSHLGFQTSHPAASAHHRTTGAEIRAEKITGIEGSITNFFSVFHLRARHDHWPIQSASILFSLTSQWNSDMWTIVFWVFNEQLACIENFLKVCFSSSCPCVLGLFVKHPTLSGCCCLIHKPPSLLRELDFFAHLHTYTHKLIVLLNWHLWKFGIC